MSPEISIGLPFKDDRGTLELALRSVFSQTREDWELLLMDDGSADGSLELARAIDDDRVRVLSDGLNKGLAARLNEISERSTGRFVVRMDADDAMHPARIASQVDLLEERQEVSLVASPAFVIDAADNVVGITGEAPLTREPGLFLRNRVIVHPTITARRSWMVDNPYDPRLTRSQDKELFARTHATSTFVKLSDPLLFYRAVGQFRLSSYVEQRRLERDIHRRFGPSQVGSSATRRSLGASFAKEAAYRGLQRIGRASAVYDRVSQRDIAPLGSAETDRARETLEIVRATAIPGLD